MVKKKKEREKRIRGKQCKTGEYDEETRVICKNKGEGHGNLSFYVVLWPYIGVNMLFSSNSSEYYYAGANKRVKSESGLDLIGIWNGLKISVRSSI